MSQFEEISVDQILVLSKTLAQSSLTHKEFVEAKYSRSAPNFDHTVEFLRELGLVAIRRNQIVIKPRYQAFLQELTKSRRPKEAVRELILGYLLTKRTPFSDYTNRFMSNFHFKHGRYEFAPTTSERLEYSGLRNFLIDLGFLYLAPSEMKYVIADNYTPAYSQLVKSYEVSPEEFLAIQERKGEIGRAAELRIIEYEKERLSQFPQLAARIEHIAATDVTAGYDIRSFDCDNGTDPTPRFIEVKAVSAWDYGFNWTRNEIETSRLFHRSYCLYLLPLSRKKQFDVVGLRIIRDPYANVYRNRGQWTRRYELLAFALSDFPGGSHRQDMDSRLDQ